ncbi:MAG TPA: type II 3-dehydroquinate dehydratase [Nocardioidaceae bacterium]|nr:type II 3-dehydroquinate dehydratase [Nocardioidaceae bacterium]
MSPAAPEAQPGRRVHVFNGPNLNLLGTREPAVYGTETLQDLRDSCARTAADLGLALDFRQTNHEGELVDWVQEAGRLHREGGTVGAVVNAGAYTHTSVALRDALTGSGLRFVEVHISNVHAREPFRHHSYLSDVAAGVVVGLGTAGYGHAMRALADHAQRS